MGQQRSPKLNIRRVFCHFMNYQSSRRHASRPPSSIMPHESSRKHADSYLASSSYQYARLYGCASAASCLSAQRLPPSTSPHNATLVWEVPRYPAYNSKAVMLRSYIGWPHGRNPSPILLSTAGFYYSGNTIYHNASYQKNYFGCTSITPTTPTYIFQVRAISLDVFTARANWAIGAPRTNRSASMRGCIRAASTSDLSRGRLSSALARDHAGHVSGPKHSNNRRF